MTRQQRKMNIFKTSLSLRETLVERLTCGLEYFKIYLPMVGEESFKISRPSFFVPSVSMKAMLRLTSMTVLVLEWQELT